MSGLFIVLFSANTKHDEAQDSIFATGDWQEGYTCLSDRCMALIAILVFPSLFCP
jgi:hypothetical protein